MSTIQIENLSMRFGVNEVLSDINFEVNTGETFGLLGSNGCGKTTLIRNLLGIYQPTLGNAHINGKRYFPGSDLNIGYLPEERGLYKKEIVLNTMTYFGQLKGMSYSMAKKYSINFLDKVDLLDKQKIRLDKLSGGQQQKIQIGIALMNEPSLLILDEPSKGLDPVNRAILNELINERKKAGATILLVSHDMNAVERLCDRILILKDGKIKNYGTVAQVQEQYGGIYIDVITNVELANQQNFEVLNSKINPEGKWSSTLKLQPGIRPEAISKALFYEGTEIFSFMPHLKSLNEIFLEVYGSAPEESEGL
jgi:ABC-2 type transport system ATP-binding protein